jgi:3-oxoacyl-[acyl-carrier-protein] synthase-3
VSVAARIAGVGSSLPERVVTNDDLAAIVDTSDAWVVSRTGIRSRRFAGETETTSTLAVDAASAALESAGMTASDVDLTIVATVTGDQPMPSTATFVQAGIGAGGAAFDVAAACAGFVYGLDLAAAQIETGRVEAAVVVGAEVLSRFLDFGDRTTCVLFGDGAGAVVLRPGPEPGVMRSQLAADGRAATLLQIPGGGSRAPTSADSLTRGEHVIHMRDGREVFKRAVTAMADAAERVLESQGLGADDVTLVVPHQANERIVRAVASRLGASDGRVFVDLEHVGNTSAASVPIALDRAWRSGRLAAGDLVLTLAFGAGLAWGANLIRWTAPAPGAAA